MQILYGSTDQSITLRIFGTDGTPKTDVTHSSAGLAISYQRQGGSVTAITPLSTLAATNSAHSDGGIRHRAGGDYRFDLPDIFATGADWVDVFGVVDSGVIISQRIRLTSINHASSQNLGITGIPSSGTANTTAPATPTNVSDAQTAILAKLPPSLTDGRINANLQLIAGSPVAVDTGTAGTISFISGEYVATSGGTVNANIVKVGGENISDDGDGRMEVTLPASEHTAIATEVESHLLDEGDSQMLINAIVGAIGNTNIDQAILIAAIRADLERSGGNLNTLIGRIAGNIRTAADDVTAETAQTSTIRSGLALSSELQSAAAAALTAYDPPTNSEMEARTLATANYATSASQTSILDKIGAFTGSGVNTILGFLKAIMSKAATTPSDVGGTFSATTDSIEAIKDSGSGGTGGLDPAVVAQQIRARLSGAPIRMIDAYTVKFGRIDLNVGDARVLDFGNAITLDLPTEVDLTGATTRFVARHVKTNEVFFVTGEISPNDTGYDLIFEITTEDTATLPTGEWVWQVKITLGSNDWTPNPKGDQMFVHPFPRGGAVT